MPSDDNACAQLEAARTRMIDEQLRLRGIHAANVLDAMRAVPREHFVAEQMRDQAYADTALPLGFQQTISQPYMVARAAQLAQLTPDAVVLDVGLGSGYQAAVLSRLCARVIGVELLPELAQRAAANLSGLGFSNVEVHCGDGSLGWPADAPYDAIVVAAAATQAPPALLDQLKPGGRLIIPLGSRERQHLTVFTRRPDGVQQHAYDACVYVPLQTQ